MPSTSREKPVTLKAIAERCGVSIMTASRVLRTEQAPAGGKKHVSDTVRAQIEAVAEEMGYDPTLTVSARRLLNLGRHKPVVNQAVALFFPLDFVEAPYFQRIYRGISHELITNNYALVVVHQYDPLLMGTLTDPMANLPSILTRGEVDGIIVMGTPKRLHPVLIRLKTMYGFGDRPIISLLDPVDGCTAVLEDDFAGGYAAAAHLLELGHRRILHFYPTEETSTTTSQRLAGIRQAVLDHQLDPDAVLLCTIAHADRDYLTRTMESLTPLMKSPPEFTAVLAPNDWIATVLVDFFRQAGLRIPGDVSLVGFDDTHTSDQHGFSEGFTTVRVPLHEIGRMATHLLFKQINGEAPQDVVLPVELIVRNTTAPPPPGR